jgi:hypothetical protein
MGTLVKCKEGTIETKYRLISEGKSFLLTIRSNENFINVYLGGLDKYCVEAQITPQTSRFAAFQDASIGYLTQIYYNAGCSIEGGFAKGVDTRRIVRLMISYIATTYPHVKMLKFTDASTLDCKYGVVELPYFYYLLNGKTWYESRFNAINVDMQDKFNKAHHQFTLLKQTLPWLDFKSITGIQESYASLYASTKTWQEFFRFIADAEDDMCTFVSPWLTAFMRRLFQFRFESAEYRLPVVSSIQYTVEPYKGGKRYTRKNARVQYGKHVW